MPILLVHGFHRLSSFLSGQKGTYARKRAAEPPEPTASQPPFIHPGFLNVAAVRGILPGYLA